MYIVVSVWFSRSDNDGCGHWVCVLDISNDLVNAINYTEDTYLLPYSMKILKIGIPKILTVIVLVMEQFGFPMQ